MAAKKARRRARPAKARPVPAARASLTRAVRLWVEVSPGPYGVVYSGGDQALEPDEGALSAIASRLVFPSLDITWSVSPEALGSLSAGISLAGISQVFGRARRAFLTVELEGESALVLGLWPNATLGSETPSGPAERATELVSGLVPILVPIAGPLGALVKGAGVLFRAAFGSSRRREVEQVAFQRDTRVFGWCFARGDKGAGLLEGLHRVTALLSVPRELAAAPGAELRGVLRMAVDLDGTAENVFLEHRFALPLAPYASAARERPSPKLREARKPEDLPLLLTVAEAASLLGLGAEELFRDGAFRTGFEHKFLSFVLPRKGGDGVREPAVVIDRDSFFAFVRKELLK